MRTDFDIVITGSGFAGSLLALIARRLGRSVALIERGRHPRFAMGESSTPLANLLLEEIARRYELPRLLPFTKWGTWQASHPEVACGLKRGFTFYHHRLGGRWQAQSGHDNELLVAASPHDGIADTHWFRADFDHWLVREAQAAGVEYLDETQLDVAEIADGRITLRGRRGPRTLGLRARFVADATGPRGFLHRALGLQEQPFEQLPATAALFNHFQGVRHWEELHPSAEAPPYPPDDAALHHVFPGGWMWVLRFNNGLTSAGVATTPELARELNLAEGAGAWDRLLDRLPGVREQFATAATVQPWVQTPRLPFRSARAAGTRWALLPSAAGFVDPLLSTGFPLTLLGVLRLGKLLEHDGDAHDWPEALAAYERQTLRELSIAGRLVAALYSRLEDFSSFRALTLLYFAAASFTETARRLGRPELAGGAFLAADHADFGPRSRECIEGALLGGWPASQLMTAVSAAIAPIDVAGLGDASRGHWYPARAEDLFAASSKLGASRQEIEALLVRSGYNPTLSRAGCPDRPSLPSNSASRAAKP